MLVINLDNGSMYVAFDFINVDRTGYFATKGKFTDLPAEVRERR